ncbi:RepA protein [Citrobacter portucalensis]|nr:RepA protein [Citrobacter portucalensis]
MIKSRRVYADLMRRRRISLFWVNKGNRDGVSAEIALLHVILDNLDLCTWQPVKNLELLAEQAGLVTYSQAGGKSISRASRAAERLVRLGIITAPKAYFNPYDARCECKEITVTEAFFQLLGIDAKKARRERARLAGEPREEADNVTLNHPQIIATTLENRARMMAAGLSRMKARRDRAREARAASRETRATPA